MDHLYASCWFCRKIPPVIGTAGRQRWFGALGEQDLDFCRFVVVVIILCHVEERYVFSASLVQDDKVCLCCKNVVSSCTQSFNLVQYLLNRMQNETAY